ncbi:hypothetical protein KY289_017987 [Solanum tuberosum]|nr:hypothetical protein KY289_017987 [Solanum tuberosum]
MKEKLIILLALFLLKVVSADELSLLRMNETFQGINTSVGLYKWPGECGMQGRGKKCPPGKI